MKNKIKRGNARFWSYHHSPLMLSIHQYPCTTIYYPHHSPFFESKVINYEGEPKQLITPPPLTQSTLLYQDLILTRTTPGNTKPQTGGAFTTKPQCRQTTSSWILSSTKCVCLHSGHAITTFCVLVACILIIDP